MAKSRKYNSDEVFKGLISSMPDTGEPEDDVELKQAAQETQLPAQPVEVIPENAAEIASLPQEDHTEQREQPAIIIGEKHKSGDKPKEKLRQQSYYLTNDLVDALAIKVFNERNNKPNPDKSAIVRRALEKELAAELAEIRKRG